MYSVKFLALASILLSCSSSALGRVQQRDDSVTCPGVLDAENGSTQSCCVGGVLQPLTLSVCKSWPICVGPTTVTPTTVPLSCVTLVPVTASDWNSIASSYKSSMEKFGTTYYTTLGVGRAAITSSGSKATSTEVYVSSSKTGTIAITSGPVSAQTTSSSSLTSTSSSPTLTSSSTTQSTSSSAGFVATNVKLEAICGALLTAIIFSTF